jgi:hypothetical protein
MAWVFVRNTPKIVSGTPVCPIPCRYRTRAFAAPNSVRLSSPKPTGISVAATLGRSCLLSPRPFLSAGALAKRSQTEMSQLTHRPLRPQSSSRQRSPRREPHCFRRLCRRMPGRCEEARRPRAGRLQAGRRHRHRDRLDRRRQGAVQRQGPPVPHAQAHGRADGHRAMAQPRRPAGDHLHHRRRDRRIREQLLSAHRAQGRRRSRRDRRSFPLVEESRRQDRRAPTC